MILKRVKKHGYVGASRYTGYIARSIRLILECGHDQYRKASQAFPSIRVAVNANAPARNAHDHAHKDRHRSSA